ncbi:hypothetical protein XMM379_001015 [Aliiroseovarius sp. xm-m-379]|uniref:hypothetical protein n=1 Tax=unclassified Aliiroseovarius TaxID=2623558 RepID=UPI0015685CC1|nr:MULTISPECIES: hypothetical protein [unclassified Aliiroseovarius]NRP12833.1 hypothetical protein [Aliiroseovarius sp. xm-d-517]NRP24334.1 hypothetical protein [Aliiroseovarius sp. xm-m-379]NRP29854.1 hypothetical protein [Aliiroseovarius sp. xm-m-314]NRP33133.1 hypothetical protein [Aliiroseovarius sp. xm-a-104]NRP39866.1 hypothetical protein [Aliiroseovarius sp. xm-m-339-2]
MTNYPNLPRRQGNPMAQVIAALIKRHGRWRVLRAALFAGAPLPRRHRQAPGSSHLAKDMGLPEVKDLYPPASGRDVFW